MLGQAKAAAPGAVAFVERLVFARDALGAHGRHRQGVDPGRSALPGAARPRLAQR